MHSLLIAFLALPILLGAQQPGARARARELGVAPELLRTVSGRGAADATLADRVRATLSRYNVNAR
ncbi:MAG TPA: hypothetical protein VG432_13695 [Gemmatimonadaceae bacterium]|nr:hypothetical protein [Gemmatimonadaceae bacterium]